jgi:hypothetical protein
MATIQAATEGEGMKIRRLMTLIVGITSVALSPLTFAGGHGGGAGGFGGGGGSHHRRSGRRDLMNNEAKARS